MRAFFFELSKAISILFALGCLTAGIVFMFRALLAFGILLGRFAF